jgi:hypothetical protein
MRESPSASALRIVERDLEWSLVALRELVALVEEAALHLVEREPELARRLRTEASSVAYGRVRGGKPLVSGRALGDLRSPNRADRGLT